MRFHEIITESPAFPAKTFKVLCHVGSMNSADKRQGSYEGSGLSVSLHPEEWREIARGFVYGDTWQLTKDGNRFLHFYKLSKSQKKTIADWGIAQGLAVPAIQYKIKYWDADEESWRYFIVNSKEEADAEIADYEEYDTPYKVTEVLTGLSGTEKLAKLSHQTTIAPGEALDFITIVYADQVLRFDGVWWQERLDPARLSAPRGVIFADRINEWTIHKLASDNTA